MRHLQCKPVRHNLKPDAIFGQELAEMLAEVQRLREYHRLNRYMVSILLPIVTPQSLNNAH